MEESDAATISRWPNRTDSLVEATNNGTLTLATDGSYIKNLNRNINGAVYIIQDRANGKRILESLAEWSAPAGSYHGELLGSLTV